MRVIAGKAKGHGLKSVPGKGTRPITDRAKSALFSILSYHVVNSRFLDLFAGTGQVGIEALSRGAKEAVFVERARKAIRTINDNLAHTKLAPLAQVIRADVFDFLRHERETQGAFDYIYVAPPQYKGLWVKTLRLLNQQPKWLVDDGQVIVQIDPLEYEEQALEHFVLVDQRSYGGVMLCFYTKVQG